MTPLSPAAWQTHPGEFIALWTSLGRACALYDTGLVTTDLHNASYPALSPRHPGAAWFERLAIDLNQHHPAGINHTTTAIDHHRNPDGTAPWPEFAIPTVPGAHQIALGPVHGEITEPAHFRLAVVGERILHLDLQLGFSHRGVLALLRGKSARLAARFAARLAGDATVAHSLAFAHAAEAALAAKIPPRAIALRAIMAELERAQNHCADLAAIIAEAGHAALAARFARQRESLCAAAQAAFGHRLMMDMVIPGGIAGDLKTAGAEAIHHGIETLAAALPRLTHALENHTGLQNRLTGTGRIPPALAQRYAAGGPVGRASGRTADARKTPGYPPYATLDFTIPHATAGDIAARASLCAAELATSEILVRTLLATLPAGPIAIPPANGSGTGLGVAESARGPCWHWLQIDSGLITDAFIADPATLHWPLLGHAARTGTVADFPLIARSITATNAGVDL